MSGKKKFSSKGEKKNERRSKDVNVEIKEDHSHQPCDYGGNEVETVFGVQDIILFITFPNE